MISQEHVNILVETYLENTDCFLVDISVSRSNRIKIFIDTDQGVTVEDCKKTSRFIESKLDRETEDFELEVTSPGLDKPFRVRRQYVKNIGKDIKIVTFEGKEYKGKLMEVSDQGVLLELNKKSGKAADIISENINNKIVFDFEAIKEAKHIISFK